MSLSEKEKQEIIGLIQEGRPLPKEYIYKLYADEEDVFLFWNGRNEQVTNAALPFHSIEHIDEPRQEVEHAPTMFDTKGRQLQGWTNKLIWGDNKLILSSLANGPLREEIEREGGLKLIYIDPPFAVGADFGFDIEVGGETAEKRQTVIEEIAYRDTWERGMSSYLSMLYDRLRLMHGLLSADGSIYVHCDWRVNAHVRLMLDDVFGSNNFINEIVWKRAQTVKGNIGQGSKFMGANTDTLFAYGKSPAYVFNNQFLPYTEEYVSTFFKYTDPGSKRKYRLVSMIGPGGSSKGNPNYEVMGVRRYWRYSEATMQKLIEQGLVVQTKPGTVPQKKQYLDEGEGVSIQTLWDDVSAISASSTEGTSYPTQKPEALLERILKTSSNEGDLVADFFGGSGTTAAVAEKLGRKWITCDLGRFGIHTTRKRMIGVQRELKADGKNYRAFEVLNLGKYERQFFMDNLVNGARKKKEQAYLNLILQAYHAQAAESFTHLHGRKAGRMVHVGPLDVPVTKQRVLEIFEECKSKLITKVDVLGFEFEMGLMPNVFDELREQGVDMVAKYIPKDVFDPRAVEKGQVKFFDVAYLNAKAHVSKRKVKIELVDFVTKYTQDDLEEVEKQLKKGAKVVIENGRIVKLSKDKDGFVERTVLTESWQDWVDYWAIDFNYRDKREVIRVPQPDGTVKEEWTGNYLFENEWQSFRTRKDPKLEYTSVEHEYPAAGTYHVMVKVIDILGVDTSRVMEVRVK
ncbi:MAG TPA: DNA methyltransferase [Flavobacteriales bacterium]|nr:DNA methyltransferase [Flavobacteriales bacterium]HMR26895.1 DNA methyltransferase [Flavobacteriales bacterium]